MASPAKTHLVLEINLISAQGLKPPSTPRRRLRTYAVTWINESTKLRTRVDKIGGQNPTWNDKFLFRVTSEFLASETSGISVAIYAIGTFRDHLVGTVRFLISNIISSSGAVDSAPCFTAVQIRRPSGRFHGVMNIGAMVIDGSGFPALDKISAIGYHDLMGEKTQLKRTKTMEMKSKEGDEVSSESCENSFRGEGESSTTSSSDSPKTTALKDWNGIREMAGSKGLTAAGFLCCLAAQRNIHSLTPSKSNLDR